MCERERDVELWLGVVIYTRLNVPKTQLQKDCTKNTVAERLYQNHSGKKNCAKVGALK